MSSLLANLLSMSAVGGVVIGVMLLLRPVTARIFPADWQYRIGKMAIVFFLLPVSLVIGKLSWLSPQLVSLNHYPQTLTTVQETSQINGFWDMMDALMGKHLSVEVMEAISFVWFVGATVFAVWHIYCYRRFAKELRANSISVAEEAEAALLLSSCQRALGIRGKVMLMQNGKITSPMLVGLLHPVILLPTSNMWGIDLKLVLTHELMHLKRKDLWVKVLALAAGTLHWFNPLAHILRQDVNTWGELSCDEALVAEMSQAERKHYGETILNTLDISAGIETAFCSSMGGSRKHIERRLTMLLNAKKMKKHMAVLAVAAILAIGGVGTATAAFAARDASQPVPSPVFPLQLLQLPVELDVVNLDDLSDTGATVENDRVKIEVPAFVGEAPIVLSLPDGSQDGKVLTDDISIEYQ
ncbi:M56 family metallopeptidase [Pelotomaculum terephthalicicum JT]|uniref:M56 family metallopeptidase n=1 Tax=Pelotomaculum terephthalicicum TaxID=206393 RepID=UPI0009D252CF|nr:M56 family metallopeptidase [Pelotomaculum terephthalicicum]MCG9969475.1 M56 family metallopeptidase [Pelotomaculum terephthalicicum JT]OPX92048.1 MAG: Regulatory protein BlaR1 [Pelotomaculum sp. PtaB.Bin104]OPY60920.1 MAG: Regulatory protein BlaR1 [Pelotomaculum sp. PtaU1.Bin065]